MTGPEHTYTSANFNSILAANAMLRDFEKFALGRFAEYTQFTEVIDERGIKIEPVQDAFARTNSGFGHWRLASNWIDIATAVTGAPYLLVENYVADDRGPGSVQHKVRMPLSFIFGEDEREAQYAEYLRLKSVFEPASNTQATTAVTVGKTRPPREPEDSLPDDFTARPQGSRRERREAALTLWIHSGLKTTAHGSETGEHLADPANARDAAHAYDLALQHIGHGPGTKESRRAVHDAGHILGVNYTAQRGETPASGAAAQPTRASSASEQATTGLGFSLLDMVTEKITGTAEKVTNPDTARKAYEKARAFLTLSGDEVFGEHSSQVLSLIDDAADLLGLNKKK